MNIMDHQAPIPGVGHNMPPLGEILQDHVRGIGEANADLIKRADELAGAADRAKINDQDSAGKGALLVKMVNAFLKDVEARRKAMKEPFISAGKLIDAQFEPLEQAGKTAKQATIAKIDKYSAEEERKAAAERQRLAAEAEAARKAAEAAIGTAAAVKVAEAEALAEQAQKVAAPEIRSDYGASASSRTLTKWRVKDETLVPPEFWCIDEKKITEAVKAGTPVPGIETYTETKTIVR